ncbi:M48 family metalloprotease [Geothermobacter hydrogeniphilus]|nr:M48 family metalloprotease [Geothermobacter hydrogeniphilus]
MWQKLLWFCCALALTGCAVNPVTGRNELALSPVSTQQEIEMGQKAFPRILQKMGADFPDPELDAYVNRVGMRLARVSHRPDLPYRFKVVNDSSPNAFALPGGSIAISRGLLVGLQNEAQLAAVLGHEIGHVTARHAVQGMQRESLLNLGLAVLGAAADQTPYAGLAGPTGQLAAGLIDKTYSREQESEADRLGIDYMVKAGYNPLGSVQVQEYFYRQIEGGARPSWLAGLFRSHPFSRDRMRANDAYVRQRYAATLNNPAYRLDVDPFQAAVRNLRTLEPGYRLYDRARLQERKGDLNGAIATYLQAAAKAPDQALILTGLGMAYLKAGDPRSARRHLARAVRLQGDYYRSRLGLGYVLLQQHKTARAVTQLERSMDLYPTAQGGFLLAEGYEKTDRSREALQLYQAVARADARGELGQAAARRAARLAGRR